MLAPGRKVPKQSLVAVLSAAPRRGTAEPGTSWIGSPPEQLRRSNSDEDSSRTYDPPRLLKAQRALVEACRVLPMLLGVLLHLGVGVSLLLLVDHFGWWTVLMGGPVMIAAGTFLLLSYSSGNAKIADYLAINRANWDSRAPIHAQNYGIERLLEDPSALSQVVTFDLPRLGDIAGLDVVHLQCHIGTDTLSLHRLGGHLLRLHAE